MERVLCNRRHFIRYGSMSSKLVSEEIFYKCLNDITKEEYNMLEKEHVIYRGNITFFIKDKYEEECESTRKRKELVMKRKEDKCNRCLDFAIKKKTHMMPNIENNGVLLAEKWDGNIQALMYEYNEKEYVFVYRHNENAKECVAFYKR